MSQHKNKFLFVLRLLLLIFGLIFAASFLWYVTKLIVVEPGIVVKLADCLLAVMWIAITTLGSFAIRIHIKGS